MSAPADYVKVPELTLGWRLQMALDEGRLKHGDLVERFEVSRQTVTRWCRDIGPTPKKFILNEIAVMCGVSARWLIEGIGTNGDGNPPEDGGWSRLPESNRRPIHYKVGECDRNRQLSLVADAA